MGKWKHGEATRRIKTPEYNAWARMRQRCYDSKLPDYKNYGGRGIKICKRWQIYSNFISDMGRKPGPEYTLGRINNNGNYTPENTRWETRTQQTHNRREWKLKSFQIRFIRKLYQQGYSQYEIAKIYKVNQSSIQRILAHKTWKEKQ